jgi:hypothetical protein
MPQLEQDAAYPHGLSAVKRHSRTLAQADGGLGRLTDCSHLQENPDGCCSDGADYHPEHPVS